MFALKFSGMQTVLYILEYNNDKKCQLVFYILLIFSKFLVATHPILSLFITLCFLTYVTFFWVIIYKMYINNFC